MNTEKKSRHVHADIIKAWLEGETVQVYVKDLEMWTDYATQRGRWVAPFDSRDTYRIKPKPVTIRYRVGLFKNDSSPYQHYTSICSSVATEELWEGDNPRFIKWLTDRVEVEVPSDD